MKTSYSQIFCDPLSLETFFWPWLNPDPFKRNYFDNFGNSKVFHTVKLERLNCKKELKIILIGTAFPIFSLKSKFGIKRISSLF